MSCFELLLLLLIAAVCGSIAQALAGYSHGGCLANIALGFIGALLGTWLQRLTGLPDIFSLSIGGHDFPIIWSIIGACLFSAVLGFLMRGRRRI